MLEVRPTEADDQGEWKVVATSEEGAISISTCDIKMISALLFKRFRIRIYLPIFQFRNTSKNQDSWTH